MNESVHGQQQSSLSLWLEIVQPTNKRDLAVSFGPGTNRDPIKKDVTESMRNSRAKKLFRSVSSVRYFVALLENAAKRPL